MQDEKKASQSKRRCVQDVVTQRGRSLQQCGPASVSYIYTLGLSLISLVYNMPRLYL